MKMSTKEKQDREHFLRHNVEAIEVRYSQARDNDPSERYGVLLLDLDDSHAHEIANAIAGENETREHRERCHANGVRPTVQAAVPAAMIESMLIVTHKSLAGPFQLVASRPGIIPVCVIGMGGKTIAQLGEPQ
jgi:hypothetical protein